MMPADDASAGESRPVADVDTSTLVIAIDGPSGSGKSTVSRGVARALGLRYLDTGAIYRALTWAVIDRGVDSADADSVVGIAEQFSVEVSTDPDDGAVVVAGRDVRTEIRSIAVTRAVSAVSALPEVRRLMVALQRRIIGSGGIVVEGRDIGTVVCRDSPVKLFLTASADERAARRSADAFEPETAADLDAVKADLARRDSLDSTRVDSPLLQAPDAIALDSTAMDAEAVVAYVVKLVATRTGTSGVGALDQIGDRR